MNRRRKILSSNLGNSFISTYRDTPKDRFNEWIEFNRTPWEQFYPRVHELPEFWVIDALITERVIEKIGAAEKAKLKREIGYAISRGDFNHFYEAPEAYDWSAARRRIKEVFVKYGVGDEYIGRA